MATKMKKNIKFYLLIHTDNERYQVVHVATVGRMYVENSISSRIVKLCGLCDADSTKRSFTDALFAFLLINRFFSTNKLRYLDIWSRVTCGATTKLMNYSVSSVIIGEET